MSNETIQLGSAMVKCSPGQDELYIVPFADRNCEGEAIEDEIQTLAKDGETCYPFFGITSFKIWDTEKMDYDYYKPEYGEHSCVYDFQFFHSDTNCSEPDWEAQSMVGKNFYRDYWVQGACWEFSSASPILES